MACRCLRRNRIPPLIWVTAFSIAIIIITTAYQRRYGGYSPFVWKDSAPASLSKLYNAINEHTKLPHLPLDIWTPLQPRDTGLSELALRRCYIPPSEIAGKLCAPSSTPAQDVALGPWVKVDRILNIEARFGSGWLYLYYRRADRRDANVVVDIQLLEQDQQPDQPHEWTRLALSIRSGTPNLAPLYLWYKLAEGQDSRNAQESGSIITELDVLYGEDIPWYAFSKVDVPILPPGRKKDSTWLTYRRGYKVSPHAPPLRFSPSGTFKILQIADVHLSLSAGTCLDIPPSFPPCPSADNLTHSFASHVIDLEKPDLLIFTGDQLDGQGRTWDAKSVIAKFGKFVADSGIPWAVIFGNHDSEKGVAKEEQMEMYRALPYGVAERGPKDVHGVGNYVVTIYGDDSLEENRLTLYFLDSGDYVTNIFGITTLEYDYIRQNQINWFLKQSASIPEIQRPRRPTHTSPTSSPYADTFLAKPNAMMFFHIVLPQIYNDADIDPITKQPLDVGNFLEEAGNSKYDDGFFEKVIVAAKEGAHGSAKNIPEVKVVGFGHDHINDNCKRLSGTWFCYGGGSGYGGYGQIGVDRRFRVYDISDWGETIRTYKRTDSDRILDEMYIVGDKAAPFGVPR